jgi:hypothetical protein
MSSAQTVVANYDHPEYLVVREQRYDRVGITSSTLDFARFRARVKCYVSNILIGIRSAASLAALTAFAVIMDTYEGTVSAVAGSTVAWVSATSVGSVQTIALNLTLNADQWLGLKFTDAKGKVYVEYQYQVLPA